MRKNIIKRANLYVFQPECELPKTSGSSDSSSTEENSAREWLATYEREQLPLCLANTEAAWDQASNITDHNAKKAVSLLECLFKHCSVPKKTTVLSSCFESRNSLERVSCEVIRRHENILEFAFLLLYDSIAEHLTA